MLCQLPPLRFRAAHGLSYEHTEVMSTLGSRGRLTWIVQDLMLDRVVQDDHALAPAGSHVGLQRAPEQREVP